MNAPAQRCQNCGHEASEHAPDGTCFELGPACLCPAYLAPKGNTDTNVGVESPPQNEMSKWRNKKTGTIYASVEFNDTPVATVTTDAGAVFTVYKDRLEPATPPPSPAKNCGHDFDCMCEYPAPPPVTEKVDDLRTTIYTKIASVAKQSTTDHLLTDMTEGLMRRITALLEQARREARIDELNNARPPKSDDGSWVAWRYERIVALRKEQA